MLAGVLVIVAGLNDIGYAKRKSEPPMTEPNVEEPAIDVEASVIEDTPNSIGPTTKLLAVEVEAQEVSVSDHSEVSPPPAVTEELLPQPTPKPRTRDELIEALERECPALLDLVESHPLRVVGVQRSGKTTLVKVLALLRMVLIPNHNVIASTPHYEEGNEYPNAFNVVGLTPNHKRDYPAIQREWGALANRIYASVKGNTTTIWDEFGVYGDILTEEELTSVLTSSLRETMKFGEYPIFIVHGETKAFIPGSNGLVGNFLHSTVRVETIGEKVKGTAGLKTIRPTGKFKVKGLDGTRDSGQIPQWLTEEFLLQLLPHNPIPPTSKPDSINPPTPTDKQLWDRAILEASDDQINALIERMRKGDNTPNGDVKDTHSHNGSEQVNPLNESEQKLVDFASERSSEWLAPSWFTNNKEYFKTWKAEQVIALFHHLKDKGYGDTIWANGTHKFCLNPPEP